jgi:hypothetical protein
MSLLLICRTRERILAASDSETVNYAGERTASSTKIVPLPGARAILCFVGDSSMAAAAISVAVIGGKPFAKLVADFRQQLDNAYEEVKGVNPQIANQARHVIILGGFGAHGAQVHSFTKTYDSPFVQEEIAEFFAHPPLAGVPPPTDRATLLDYLDLQVPAVRHAHPGVACGGEAWILELTRHRVTIERSHKLAPRPWTPADGITFQEWQRRQRGGVV